MIIEEMSDFYLERNSIGIPTSMQHKSFEVHVNKRCEYPRMQPEGIAISLSKIKGEPG